MAESKNFSETFHHVENENVYDDLQSNSYEIESRQGNEPIIDNFPILQPLLTAPPPPTPSPRSQMYGVMVAPSPYNGESNPKMWLNEYEVIAEANLWNDDMKMRRLIGVLTGAARRWFLNQRMCSSELNWTTLKQGLIDRFSNSCDELMAQEKIMRTKQNKTDFNLYWEDKVALIKSTSPHMTEKDVMTALINGLNKDLYPDVLKFLTIHPCNTLDELRNLIKNLSEVEHFVPEKYTNFNSNNRRVRFNANAYMSGTDDDRKQRHQNTWRSNNNWIPREDSTNEIAKLNNKVDELKIMVLEKFKDEPKTPLPQLESQIPIPKIKTDSNWKKSAKCFSCNEIGHISRDCPNKKTKAYKIKSKPENFNRQN
jgi:hypothetical protein